PALRAQLVQAAAGSPLTLALAADMVLQFGIRNLATLPEWRVMVRTLVERLLRDVSDPTLRELLEVCAVVRHFDEGLLAAVTGREEIGPAFAQLCRLSAVRPAEQGLLLHEDFRRALSGDLRWR